MNRRKFGFTIAGLTLAPLAALAAESRLIVSKSPTCGCCGAWVQHMRVAGFSVETRDLSQEALLDAKARLGVPQDLVACHTGEIEGYAVEGHVPAEDVKLLLAFRPEIAGLAVPGMPVGSPGMEMDDTREPFDVIAFSKEGGRQIFSRHR